MNGELWPDLAQIWFAKCCCHSMTETILGNAYGNTGQEQPDTWIWVKGRDTDDILGFLQIDKWIQHKTSHCQGSEGIIASLLT